MSNNEEWHVEIRPTAQRTGKPRFVPLSSVDRETGFRSIAAFSAELVELIQQQGGTFSLRGHKVYCDTLFLDFDGHDPVEFRAWLQASGLGYTEYNSGHRSVHVHIPIEPVYSAWITDAMKAWVREHAPTADTSFYHPAGLYRLPGTFHYKTGRQKVLVASRGGQPLKLTEPAGHQSYEIESEGRLETFFTHLTAHKNEGQRAPWIWRLAMLAAEAGLSYDEALDHLRWANERFFTPPRDDLTIQRQTQSAYRRLAKKEA